MADFSLPQRFAQWFFRKCTLTPRTGGELGWQERKDILALATGLPKLREQGLEKMCVRPKVSSVLLISPSFLHSGTGLPSEPRAVCGSGAGDQDKRRSIGGSQGWWNQRFCGSFSHASLHQPTVAALGADLGSDGQRGAGVGETGPSVHLGFTSSPCALSFLGT